MPSSGPVSDDRVVRGGERLLGWCLGLGLLLLVLAQLPSYSWQGYVVVKLVVLAVLVGLLLLLLGLGLFNRPRTDALTVDWYTLAGIAFVVWSTVTALTGTNPGASFYGTVFRYEGVLGFFAYLVVFLAARRLASSRFMPGRLVLLLGAVAVGAIGLLGILQHVWPADGAVDALSLFWTSRSQSTFTNPIMLGLFGCLALPVLLALLSERPQGWEQPVLTIAASLIAAGAFLSYSRAFWLAAPIGCAVALVLAGPPQAARWRAAIPTAAFAALCIVVALQVGNAGPDDSAAQGDSGNNTVSVSGRVGETLSGGGSVRSRMELYRGALTLIAERSLLGRGFETYTTQAARTRTEALIRLESHFAYADRPHNSLLYVAYATGLPGLVLYVLFLGGALLAAFRRYRSRVGPEKVLAAGLLGSVVAYLLAEQTVFSTIEVSPLFFAMLGWAAASPGRTAQETGERAAKRSWARGFALPPRYVPALAALVVLGAVGWTLVAVPHALDVLAADLTHYRLATRPQERDLEESVREELGAARRDPYTPYYWNTAALMLQSAAEQSQRPAELQRAREVLEEGLRHLPGDPTLVVSLSSVLFQSNRPSEVVALLVPYLEADKYQADGHYNLGVVFLSMDRPGDALPHLEAAVRFNPQDADSHWYLGEAYRALGRAADAEREQQTAASLDPEYKAGSGG